MRKLMIGILAIVGLLTGALMYNHYDVQARGNGDDYDPAVPVLRTPDARFDALEDFPYAPHYVEIDDAELGPLRVHYLDEGPRTTDWLAKGVIKQHRTLATYLNLLIAAGFTVRQVEEWGPTREEIAAHPEWKIDHRRPSFLLVSADR